MSLYSHGAICLELLLVALIVGEILTGKFLHRFSSRPGIVLRREEDPKAFWMGITSQAVPTLGGLCISTRFEAGALVFGVLYLLLGLIGFVWLSWFLGRHAWLEWSDPVVRWRKRKYPLVFWFFMTYRPQKAAARLEALLRERPGDPETLRLLAAAHQQMGEPNAMRARSLYDRSG